MGIALEDVELDVHWRKIRDSSFFMFVSGTSGKYRGFFANPLGSEAITAQGGESYAMINCDDLIFYASVYSLEGKGRKLRMHWSEPVPSIM